MQVLTTVPPRVLIINDLGYFHPDTEFARSCSVRGTSVVA
jgi:hypothetical protein